MPYQTHIGGGGKKKKKKNGGASLPDSLQLLFGTLEVLGSILGAVGLTILVWTEDWTEGLVHRLNTKSGGPVYFARKRSPGTEAHDITQKGSVSLSLYRKVM